MTDKEKGSLVEPSSRISSEMQDLMKDLPPDVRAKAEWLTLGFQRKISRSVIKLTEQLENAFISAANLFTEMEPDPVIAKRAALIYVTELHQKSFEHAHLWVEKKQEALRGVTDPQTIREIKQRIGQEENSDLERITQEEHTVEAFEGILIRARSVNDNPES